MRRNLAIFIGALICLAPLWAQTTALPNTTILPNTTLMAPASGGGGTLACGESDTSIGNQGSVNNTALFTPCSTGSDALGYTLTTLQVNLSAVTNGSKLFTALYNDTTSGCAGGNNHCPNAVVCSDTTGVTLSVAGAITDTPTGCGTLTQNTIYWLAGNNNDAGNRILEGTASPICTATSAGLSYFQAMTAGTWSAGAASVGGQCYSLQATLTGN